MERIYIAIDLKSFFASVECIKRKMNPLDTNLVVADNSRTNKTICLAVTPSLKSFGIGSRPRLFEVVKKIKEVNNERLKKAQSYYFVDKSYSLQELKRHSNYEVDYIVAKPHMSDYISYSAKIYDIYLKYVAKEDIHIYSIDEVFMDITSYLNLYKKTAYEIAFMIIKDVFESTGITATAGIGENLYLSKVAMDIVAKKLEPDASGVRIAELDIRKYREVLWDHKPITDFWRVGKGYATKLAKMGLYTMGDIAYYSLKNEDKLYKEFGINAELLIDHAWGEETCLISDIKKIKQIRKSISSGQVLHEPYSFDKARIVIKEMADILSLDLVDKGYLAKQIIITVGYDISSLDDDILARKYTGDIVHDAYGRPMPKPVHGTYNLPIYTTSCEMIMSAACNLFDKLVDSNLLVRRLYIVASNLVLDDGKVMNKGFEQISVFSDFDSLESNKLDLRLLKEKDMQRAILKIKGKYGKNAILRGLNYEEGATSKVRNKQIGGHNA